LKNQGFSERRRDFSILDISKMSKIENLNVYRENYFKSLEKIKTHGLFLKQS